jgi:hypothetical protein
MVGLDKSQKQIKKAVRAFAKGEFDKALCILIMGIANEH